MSESRTNLKSVFNHFFSGGDVYFTEIPGGLIHTTYMVRMNGNSYLLQKINTSVFPSPEIVLRNAVRISEHLKSKPDYPYRIVSPCKLANGQGFLHMDEKGGAWRLFPFVDESISYDQTSDPDLVYKAALAVANFTSFLNDLDTKSLHITIPGFHDPPIRWRQFETSILSTNSERLRMASKLIDSLKLQYKVFKKFASLQLPIRIVHNDAKLSNILFDRDSNEPIAIIDMDTTMPGTILCDFGDMVRTMAASNSEEGDVTHINTIRKDLFRAIWTGYCEGLKDYLTSSEIEHLFLGAEYIILEQAVRFLADYLTFDKYYQIRYPKHNLDRAMNQFELFQSLVSGKKRLLKV